jgi:hypothetical protein
MLPANGVAAIRSVSTAFAGERYSRTPATNLGGRIYVESLRAWPHDRLLFHCFKLLTNKERRNREWLFWE